MVLAADSYDSQDSIIEKCYSDDDIPESTETSDAEHEAAEQRICAVSDNVKNAVGKLKPTDVVLDTGGSLSMYMHGGLVDDLHDNDEEIAVTGISKDAEEIVTSLVGQTKFGPVYFTSQGAVNVLSYAETKDRA